MNKKNGDDAIVDMAERHQLLKMLSLTYYGNQLGVYFSAESMVCHSMSMLDKKKPGQAVSIE